MRIVASSRQNSTRVLPLPDGVIGGIALLGPMTADGPGRLRRPGVGGCPGWQPRCARHRSCQVRHSEEEVHGCGSCSPRCGDRHDDGATGETGTKLLAHRCEPSVELRTVHRRNKRAPGRARDAENRKNVEKDFRPLGGPGRTPGSPLGFREQSFPSHHESDTR
jgi:hypothetical protein